MKAVASPGGLLQHLNVLGNSFISVFNPTVPAGNCCNLLTSKFFVKSEVIL